MLRKTIVTAVGSAVLGALGVGYLTLGPSANADRATIVDDTTVDGSTAAVGTSSTDDAPTPPTDAERDARHAAHIQEALAPLLADGTLTQAQIDKVAAALAGARPEGGKGPRGGGRDGRGGRGGPMGERRGEGLTLAAETIGITVDALRTELQGGKTIAEVATANNVTPQAVIDALIAQATTQIDQHVTDGDITVERATEIKANLVERTTRFVNDVGPKHRTGGDQPAPTDDSGS